MRVRTLLAVVTALLVHLAVVGQLRLAGVRPDVALLSAIAAGLVGGSERGAWVGFGVGLVADAATQSPIGLSALVYSLTGYAVGMLQASILRATRWIPIAIAGAASAGGTLVHLLVAATLGQTSLVLPRIAVVVTLVAAVNAVLAPVACRLFQWANADPAGVR